MLHKNGSIANLLLKGLGLELRVQTQHGILMKIPPILSFPISPLLASLYPVLFFWSVNVNQAGSDDVWRSLLVCLGIGLVLSLFLWAVLRDPIKAALAGALIALPFFSYGHVYTWFVDNHLTYIRHTYLLPIFVITVSLLLFLVIRSRRDLKNLVSTLNIILLALSLYAVFPIARSLLEEARIARDRVNSPTPTGDSNSPDIYLIILDEYPRADVLMKTFQFDNAPFLHELESMGFRVIPCSQSNYRWTIQSVYSMLNLEYAPMADNEVFAYTNQAQTSKFTEGIKDGFVIRSLRQRGYPLVALETGYAFTELRNADVLFASRDPNQLSPFELAFIDTTMLSAWDDLSIRLGFAAGDPKANKLPRNNPLYYYRIKMNGLNHLDQAIKVPGPKFVFAHLLGVHFPIAIGKNGEFAYASGMNAKAYINQLEFVNRRVSQSLQVLIQNSEIPPIIIVMSDHGLKYDDFDTSGPYTDSLLNFSAVYGPADLLESLYDTITPVNVMRMVANQQRMGSFDPLPDISYYTDPQDHQLKELTNTCKGNP